jgi:hypothetical protein
MEDDVEGKSRNQAAEVDVHQLLCLRVSLTEDLAV